jgi:hypothetical protein
LPVDFGEDFNRDLLARQVGTMRTSFRCRDRLPWKVYEHSTANIAPELDGICDPAAADHLNVASMHRVTPSRRAFWLAVLAADSSSRRPPALSAVGVR